MKKKMFGLLGLLMMLSVAALSQELKTAGNFSQDFGHVMVKFSPEWDTENPKLQMGHLVNIRQYLPDLQRGSGPTLGINRHTDGKTFLWFYINNPETKKDWGFYVPFKLENGEKYEAVVSWQKRHVTLKANGKLLMESTMPFDMELAPTILIGGKGATAKHVKIIEYKIYAPETHKP